MAKGSGAAGGAYGTGGAGGRAAASPALQAFLARGLTGIDVPSSGLRPESFAHLRAGGAIHGGPPKITVETKGGKAHITDGRHRIMLARERGDRTIDAHVYTLGPRGASRLAYKGPVKL